MLAGSKIDGGGVSGSAGAKGGCGAPEGCLSGANAACWLLSGAGASCGSGAGSGRGAVCAAGRLQSAGSCFSGSGSGFGVGTWSLGTRSTSIDGSCSEFEQLRGAEQGQQHQQNVADRRYDDAGTHGAILARHQGEWDGFASAAPSP